MNNKEDIYSTYNAEIADLIREMLIDDELQSRRDVSELLYISHD
mgnify:CR=1 FL=1